MTILDSAAKAVVHPSIARRDGERQYRPFAPSPYAVRFIAGTQSVHFRLAGHTPRRPGRLSPWTLRPTRPEHRHQLPVRLTFNPAGSTRTGTAKPANRPQRDPYTTWSKPLPNAVGILELRNSGSGSTGLPAYNGSWKAGAITRALPDHLRHVPAPLAAHVQKALQQQPGVADAAVNRMTPSCHRRVMIRLSRSTPDALIAPSSPHATGRSYAD